MAQERTSRTLSRSPTTSPVAARFSAVPRTECESTHRHDEAVHRDVHRSVRGRDARTARARARARRRQLERLVVRRALAAAIAHQPEYVVAAVQSAAAEIAVGATKAWWSAVIRL